jgi:branched-chain amino acid aminotransferase
MGPLTFVDGEWLEGNPGIMGPMSHGSWMASTVFDGARVFENCAPDLDRHCERLIHSAHAMELQPVVTAQEILDLALEGIGKFPHGTDLYVRPMFWAETGFVAPDPESTRFCLTLHEAPMPEPKGTKVMLSKYRRPLPDTMPTDAKASCLYPTSGRALREARNRGFDNAVMLDGLGNVAELATANLWLVMGEEVATPAPNGTFLNGITKQRVKALLQDAGYKVVERRVTFNELRHADEVFSTGNYGKVMPIVRVEDSDLQPGPVYRTARQAYWDFARAHPLL